MDTKYNILERYAKLLMHCYQVIEEKQECIIFNTLYRHDHCVAVATVIPIFLSKPIYLAEFYPTITFPLWCLQQCVNVMFLNNLLPQKKKHSKNIHIIVIVANVCNHWIFLLHPSSQPSSHGVFPVRRSCHPASEI